MKAFFTTFLLLLSVTANANQNQDEKIRYYDVELIIIENLSQHARASENWPVNVTLEQSEKTIQYGEPITADLLPQGVDVTEAYKILPADSFQLSDHVKTINDSKNLRVIYHTKWRQPGLDNDTSLPIHFSHDVPAPMLNNNEQADSVNASDIENNSGTNNAQNAILEGILRVTLSRYLHLEAELSLKNVVDQKLVSDANLNFDNPFIVLDQQAQQQKRQEELQRQQVIYLNQKRRRMRSKELHYIDHPVLSILVLMTPYEKPEEETPAAALNTSMFTPVNTGNAIR